MPNRKSLVSLPKAPKLNFPRPSSKNNKKGNTLSSILRGVGIYALIGAAALVLFATVFNGADTGTNVPISQVVNDIKNGQVTKLEVEGNKVTATYKDNKTQISRKEDGETIFQILKD